MEVKMNVSRRDFMKLVGVTAASLTLTNCRVAPLTTCYVPMPPTPFPTEPATARDRLRLCWLRFGELAEATRRESESNSTDNTLGQQLTTEHLLSLEDLVETGELSPEIAGLVQEAYEAAVYHVWRSNTMITCYEPVMLDYAPSSAQNLVTQSQLLGEFAEQGVIEEELLAQARSAIEHDMAYYALTEEELASLYDRLVAEWQEQQNTIPGFDYVDLEITPEAKAAAQFIINLLITR